MTDTPVRIIFVGSGEFGLPTLRRLITEKSVQVVHVVSQPDRPAGRGRRVLPTPIAQAAADHRLPLLRTNDINAEKLPAADLLLVIAFGQKIGPALARAGGAAALGLGLGLGSINLHASLLPRHRGAAPIQHAILAGDRQTGNSIIRLDDKMDAGAVLAQSSVTIGEVETTGELHDRLADDGAALVIQTIEALAAGRAQEKPQDAALATLAPKLTPAAGKIDWTLSADQIARRIRAMWPWPGCRVQIVDPAVDAAGLAAGAEERNKATLARARALDRPAGTIRAGVSGVIDDRGHVTAGDGRQVEVIELQPQGGRLMKLADYARGRPWRAGMHVKSIG